MPSCISFNDISAVLLRRPNAYAEIKGSSAYRDINGRVNFHWTRHGVIVATKVIGLPSFGNECGPRIFAFHIHSGTSCTGNQSDPFADALTHYNPDGKEHPYHAGDLPPLFSNCGFAVSVFLTNRFLIEEVIGKTVVIHDGVDDFTSQPAGNAGNKIACGVIVR